MRISTAIKNTVIICVLAMVGAIFVFKYSTRVFNNANIIYLIVATYIVIYVTFFTFLWQRDLSQYAWASNQRLLFIVCTALIVGAVIIITVLPDVSRVSRFSAIIEWIERLLARQFPWGSQTQFNPSGLPFLFIIALPFYYAGNIGYLEVAGVILFCIVLVKFYKQPNTMWLPLIALVLLPSFYYELLVRSELFFNMMLIVALITLSEQHLDTSKLDIWFFGLAILFGLGLSTRTIVGLVYAGYYAYKFHRHIWNGILFSGFTLIIFGFTLMPFVIWNAQYFFKEGPFSVQMGYLPADITIVFVIIVAISGWNTFHLKDLFFYEGILLFVIVVIAFLPIAIHSGIYTAVLKDKFDITYFIFCTPFLLFSLENQQINRI